MSLRGVIWYAMLGLRRGRPGGRAFGVSMAAASALVWVTMSLRSEVETGLQTCVVNCTDLAAAGRDVVVLGVLVAALHATLVTVRLTLDRTAEAIAFSTLGVPTGALQAARALELWFSGCLAGATGAAGACILLSAFAAWNASLEHMLRAGATAVVVPAVALFPAGIWSWLRMRRVSMWRT